jgi:predicted transposase/invertase (TIGR01784 family)
MQPKKHIPKAHDHFFRMMMSDKRVAKEFFESHLPDDVLAVIDLNQLELQSASFIEDTLKELIADMLFKTIIAGHEAYLYLLVDHQSQPDELMPFRLLQYICNAMDQYLRKTGGKQIPLIIPMVVYHGRKPWNYSTNIKELIDAPKELIDAYFLKPFTLIDLNKIEDEVLKKRTWVGVMELTLKHIFARDIMPYFLDIVELLQQLKKLGKKQFIEIVLRYIIDRGEMSNKDAFVEIVRTGLAENGENVMTIAEQFIAEGRQRGLEEGMQKGMQKGIEITKYEIAERLLAKGINLSTIAESTGLSLKQIEQLKEKSH